MGAGKIIEDLVEALAKEAPKAKKAAKPFFPVGSEDRAANLDAFFGGTHPDYRQRYYTGTSKDKDFTAFQESRHGTWLTSSPEEASGYALQNDSMNLRPIPGSWSYEKVNSASRVIPTHARIENPYTGELPDFARADNYKKAQSDWFDTLRAQGYDAWAPASRKGDMVVILKDQGINVKSATGNNGAFDRTKKHMGYAGGGLIRELIEGVAKEAPELARGAAKTRRAVVNIGLDINGGEKLSPEEALAAIEAFGAKPQRSFIAQSDTEPTLVVELDRALNPDEAHALSGNLRQEAIAQVDENGVGDLHGPSADKWRPFNGDYFIDHTGDRLGSPDRRAGGGLIREAVEMLGKAAGQSEKKAVRLYHGTTKLPTDGKYGRWADEIPPQTKGFDELSPDVNSYSLGLHVGPQKQANYFASGQGHVEDDYLALNRDYFKDNAPTGGRISPLDVEISNPLRLEDRTGSWEPHEVYAQLVERGVVPYDRDVEIGLHKAVSGTREQKHAAMNSVRKMIEDAGHDGVVYTNRTEGYTTDDPIRNRFVQQGIDDTYIDDPTFLSVVPEAQGNDSYIVWDKNKYRSPFGDGPGVGYASGGLVDQLDFSELHTPHYAGGGSVDLGIAGVPGGASFDGSALPGVADPNQDIYDYEALRDIVNRQAPDIQSMTHVGAKPRRPVTMETFGNEFDLGDAPYDTAGAMSTMAQAGNEAARMGVYAVPVVGPFIGAGLDTAEAAATHDPTAAGMAIAFGPGGKMAKAAVTGGLAALTPDDAEAGVFGRAAKWAMSGEGKDALNDAIKMYSKGYDNGDTFAKTGWFRDVDGHWKFWRSSQGGHTIEPFRGSKLPDVYYDPHLFDQYPQMKDIGFSRKNGNGAHWDEGNNQIVLGDTSSPFFQKPEVGGKKGVFDHEIYHAKSTAEGWPQGTNVAGASWQTLSDIKRLHNLPNHDPATNPIGGPNDKFGEIIGGIDNWSALSDLRYRAEMGEALARREAMIREFGPDNLRGISPADTSLLDMPSNTLFHPGSPATKEQYQALIDYLDVKRAQDAANAAKGDVTFAPVKKTGRR